jgi:ribosomal protein S18 acetylase RimI-like enzyme
MDTVKIRKAQENDRVNISRLIATGFEKEFSRLTKDTDKVARVICAGIQIGRFYVAQQGVKLIGVAACTDYTGRAIYTQRTELRKNLGIIIGTLSYYTLRDEFMKPLTYSSEIGFIEFVTVSPFARGKGIAKQLLQNIVEQSAYKEFILEVTDINTYAIKAYTTFGFVETHRIPMKHPKHQGYNEKVYMQYATSNGGCNYE